MRKVRDCSIIGYFFLSLLSMAKMIYTMGETAEVLGESVSAVRYWSNYFDRFVKPARNGKGNRLYHPEDIDTLKQIQYLLKTKGMTLEGAMAVLKEDRRGVESKVKALELLKGMKADLEAVRKVL